MAFHRRKKLWIPLLALGSVLSFTGLAHAKNAEDGQPKPNRFDIISGSLVLDKTTGLMWQRCALGQTWDGNNCAGIAAHYRWEEAVSAAGKNEEGGYHDWYLPEKEDLESLIDPELTEPTIDLNAFPNNPNDLFWSSSAYVANAEHTKATVNYLHRHKIAVGPHSVFSYARARLVRQADAKE